MGKRLNECGLRIGIGFLGLLILFGAGGSYGKSSFKNTPLYRHVVKRGNSQPVALYENKPTASGGQAETLPKSGYEKAETDEKDDPATPVSRVEPAGPVRRPAARRSPANLTDPSTFTPQMPLSEAVEILRNSTSPKLNIVVLWKDLEENADIYPDTPIGIDGVTGVPLSRHLKSLVDGVSGGSPEKLGYVVQDGVVIIATLGSLPERMVTRVYDITDLTGQPSTGFPGFGFGMPGMGMMGMGMPGFGMQGGYGLGMPFGSGYGMQGGYGTGTPFGGGYGIQGGIVGGLTPGLGTGYGNFGTGYGSTGYGTSLGFGGSPYRPFR